MHKLQKHVETQDGREIVGKTMLKSVRCSPRKVRYVADAIRNKTVAQAFEVLDFAHRPSAVPFLRKALQAAVAAVEHDIREGRNLNINSDQVAGLIVGEIVVNDAPMIKRIRPASMGRAVRVRKRQSHIFLALTEE